MNSMKTFHREIQICIVGGQSRHADDYDHESPRNGNIYTNSFEECQYCIHSSVDLVDEGDFANLPTRCNVCVLQAPRNCMTADQSRRRCPAAIFSKAARTSLDLQTACNMGGLSRVFFETVQDIWCAVHNLDPAGSGFGTNFVNTHPVVISLADKINSLCCIQFLHDTYLQETKKAFDECYRLADRLKTSPFLERMP